jgi:hypothetical protein
MEQLVDDFIDVSINRLFSLEGRKSNEFWSSYCFFFYGERSASSSGGANLKIVDDQIQH